MARRADRTRCFPSSTQRLKQRVRSCAPGPRTRRRSRRSPRHHRAWVAQRQESRDPSRRTRAQEGSRSGQVDSAREDQDTLEIVSGMTGIVALALQLAGSAAATEASIKSARSAQECFESTRRAHLPRLRSYGGRSCDIVIGRFCYWYDSTETKPAPEPQRVVAARRQFLVLLDSLATLHPHDDWLAGQRVRYTIEGGDSTAALRAARECRATSWWCAVLEGLTLHVHERYADADAAFRRALEGMPEQQ